MKLVLYDMKKNALIYLFVFLQIAAILFTLNTKISGIMANYERCMYLENYAENLWVYERDMDSYDGGMESQQEYIKQLKEIPGVKDVGYYEEGFFYIDGILKENTQEINEICYVTPVMEQLKSRLAEGSWFHGNSNEKEFIIGGELRNHYQLGDAVTIKEADSQGEVTGIVTGILKENALIPSLSGGSGSTNTLDGHAVDNMILTNDETVFDSFEYTVINAGTLILSMENPSDEIKSLLRENGKLYTLEEAVQNGENLFKQYLRTTISKNVLLIGVVLFGVIGCTCLLMWRREKEAAVYVLLGEKISSIIIRMSGAVAVLFILASILVCMNYQRLTEKLYEETMCWYQENTIFTILLCVILIGTNVLLMSRMYGKTPKEMLTKAKEEMA